MRVADEGTGDGYMLLLPTRQRDAAAAYVGVVALR
jgi:hypothetical protein